QVRNTPTGTGFSAVAAGIWHSVAIDLDGRLVSWGSDGWGQLSGTPTGTGFIAVAAGNVHSVAIGPNHAPVANAGSDQPVTVLHDHDPSTNTASFTLNGSGSYDPDGD